MKRLLAACLIALAAFAPACAKDQPAEPIGWGAVRLSQKPASPSQAGVGAAFGALTFRGGVAISARDPSFGGWSSIKILPDGRLLAVSDKGMWLSAKLDNDRRSGRFKGLADARIGLMRDLNGDPLDGKRAGDAESLALLPDGRAAVGFEQDHRIWLYDIVGKGPAAPARAGPSLAGIEAFLASNEGLEALVATPDGDLIAGAEFGAQGVNLFRLAPPPAELAATKAAKASAAVARGHAQTTDNYGLVDFERLPDGGYVGLERFYFPVIGNKIVIRRYDAAGLANAAPAFAGPELAKLEPPLLVDNFEGIAALKLASGVTRLFIIADDNFNKTQKTLLYAFDLPAPPPPAAPPPAAPPPAAPPAPRP